MPHVFEADRGAWAKVPAAVMGIVKSGKSAAPRRLVRPFPWLSRLTRLPSLTWLGVHRALRRLLPALIVALPPLFWVVDGTKKASLAALGRDQGIFQYIAWALTQGAKDYRDVRDVNGPLTHLIHMLFLALGGRDEHRFRVLDLTVTGLSFAFVGACLPGIARRTRVLWTERLGWAFAGWVVLSGQYLLYIFWDLAQRESFFDWFMLSGIALQLVAQRQLAAKGPARDLEGQGRARGASALLAVASGLVVLPIFGKPTYVFFVFAALVALLADDLALTRRRRMALFAIGGAAGALTQLAFLARYADVGAFFKIYLVDVPVMYRFIWPRTVAEILSLPGNAVVAALALVTSVVMLGLVYERQMPRRALGVALVPLCGLCSVVVQAKGFPYHFHPVTAGLHLQWLLIVVWLWEKQRGAPRERTLARLAPLLAASVLALRVAAEMPLSPHVQAIWIAEKGKLPEEREEHDFLVYFQTHDFFPWEMRQAAAYLRAHTAKSDRVQTYGMDPYLLFLAERLSATPYIYAYDLNADAALSGGQLRDGLHPNGAEQARIVALRDAHEADLLARLEREPPAAFVFLDKSPLITWQDAWVDFGEHASKAASWVRAHYRQTAVFGDDRVWLRRDLAEEAPEVRDDGK